MGGSGPALFHATLSALLPIEPRRLTVCRRRARKPPEQNKPRPRRADDDPHPTLAETAVEMDRRGDLSGLDGEIPTEGQLARERRRSVASQTEPGPDGGRAERREFHSIAHPTDAPKANPLTYVL